MKSTILFFVLLISYCNISFSQIGGFELRDSLENSSICSYALEIESGGYLLFYGNEGPIFPFHDKIVKVDSYGNYISELNFDIGNHLIVHYVNEIDHDLIFMDISYEEGHDGKHQRCFLTVDQSLNVISQNCIDIPSYTDGFATNLIDGIYYFVFNIGISLRGDVCMGTYSIVDQILEYKFDQRFELVFPSSIEHTSNGNLMIYTWTGLVELDSNFDLVETYPEIGINVHGTLMNIDSVNMLIGGIRRIWDIQQEPNPVYYENVLFMYNHDREFIFIDRFDIREYPTEFRGFNYPALNKMMDVKDNSVFVAANIEISDVMFQQTPNRFQVLRYDKENMDRVWQLVFGGDVGQIIRGMIATTDGGCLVYGFRRDDSNSRSYPYVLKVDEDGLISSVHGADPLEMYAVTVFGNPSTHLRMNIQAPSDWIGILELHDLSGRLINKSSATSGTWELDPSVEFPNGVYLVSITDDNGGYQSFKWIKI